jgi:hypothetical protein
MRRTRIAYEADMKARDEEIIAMWRKERKQQGMLAFVMGAAIGIVSTALGCWLA